MTNSHIEVHVKQRLHRECLTNIELWLLSRFFNTSETTDGLVLFHAFLSLNDYYEGYIYFDDELAEALATSRQLSPELCSAIEQELENNQRILIGAIHYNKIFQSILRRTSCSLKYVSIHDVTRSWKEVHYERSMVITANLILSIQTIGNEYTIDVKDDSQDGLPYIFPTKPRQDDIDVSPASDSNGGQSDSDVRALFDEANLSQETATSESDDDGTDEFEAFRLALRDSK